MPSDEATLLSVLLRRARHEGRKAHDHVLALVEALTDEQLRWRPGSHAPSIGFHVWHLARWADFDAHEVEGTTQIWHAQGLGAAWGFPSSGLGEAEAGTEMGDDASERLVLPGKAALLDYTRSAFTAVDGLLDRLSEDQQRGAPRAPDVGDEKLTDLIFTYLTHDNRHLGMIEAVRGLLGLRGSATNLGAASSPASVRD